MMATMFVLEEFDDDDHDYYDADVDYEGGYDDIEVVNDDDWATLMITMNLILMMIMLVI